jgi:hypothetical protein
VPRGSLPHLDEEASQVFFPSCGLSRMTEMTCFFDKPRLLTSPISGQMEAFIGIRIELVGQLRELVLLWSAFMTCWLARARASPFGSNHNDSDHLVLALYPVALHQLHHPLPTTQPSTRILDLAPECRGEKRTWSRVSRLGARRPAQALADSRVIHQ